MYETAFLYVKLEEFEATLNYLNDLLDTYFDTSSADNARLLMIETMITIGRNEEASIFFQNNKEKFLNPSILDKAELIISRIDSNKNT